MDTEVVRGPLYFECRDCKEKSNSRQTLPHRARRNTRVVRILVSRFAEKSDPGQREKSGAQSGSVLAALRPEEDDATRVVVEGFGVPTPSPAGVLKGYG